MQRSAIAVLLLSTTLLSPKSAQAKDLGNRVGVGVRNATDGLPSLSARYGLPSSNPAINIQVEGNVGFNSNTGATYVGGRGLYAVVVEDNMNLYGYAALGYQSDGIDGGLRLQPGLEVQAFLFGLENLGIVGGLGLNLDVGATSGVSTAGALAAGFHYWF